MNRKLFIGAGLLAVIALILNVQLALAHESVTVGDYTVELGWQSEPPVAGQQNAIVVSVITTSDGQPVKDVSGLTVTVSYGGQEKTLSLQPLAEDMPGQFIAPLLPTLPGEYTLKLGGTLGGAPAAAGIQLEEVQPADTVQFPSVGASSPQASAALSSWLNYLSLMVGLIALVLAVMALRKSP